MAAVFLSALGTYKKKAHRKTATSVPVSSVVACCAREKKGLDCLEAMDRQRWRDLSRAAHITENESRRELAPIIALPVTGSRRVEPPADDNAFSPSMDSTEELSEPPVVWETRVVPVRADDIDCAPEVIVVPIRHAKIQKHGVNTRARQQTEGLP